MGRRVIFLDVDGVLNSVAWRENHEYTSPPGMPREHRGTQWIDPSAVERLNELVDHSGAEVVLSSSWRVRGVERIQAMLELRGFRAQLIDRTPLPDEHDPAVFRRLAGKDAPPDYVWPRGYEIQQWLDDQFDIEGIVILDDSASMEHLMPWLVRTSLADGLCDRHVVEALVMLGKPGPQLGPRPTRTRSSSEAPAWELHASDLIDLVTTKLSREDGDRPLFGTESEIWPTARWHNYFAALDRWWRWAQLGRTAEGQGQHEEASACLAAALWLQPESADSVFSRTLRQRSHDLPAALHQAFDPEFPSLPFRTRHERAWALGRSLAGLPTLLRWSCDPRPWVRVQVYRSLGRLAHPAGIQVLQEGSFDPNPRARAAAVYGLGRSLDPTAFGRLRSLARTEQDTHVRGAANDALQLIASYWDHFGAWHQLLASPDTTLECIRALGQRGGHGVARRLLDRFVPPEDPRAKSLRARLRDAGKAHASDNYEPPPRLAPDDDGASYPDPVQAHADLRASGARGFEARRAFRFLGIGMTATRRAHAPAHVD